MTRERTVERLRPKAGAEKRASYGELKGVGVAATFLAAGDRTWQHAGLLYQWRKEVRLFEMRTHKELCDQVAPPGFVWAEPAMPRERALLVAMKCQLVHKLSKTNEVPYGFGYRTSTFDENGAMRLGACEIGFTCATIVAAVLESEKIKLLDPTTWPLPDASDKATREAFILKLRDKDPEHAKVLRGDIDAPRISPAEVVAAGASYPNVGTFDSVQEGAAEVLNRIHAVTGLPPPRFDLMTAFL